MPEKNDQANASHNVTLCSSACLRSLQDKSASCVYAKLSPGTR